MARINTVLGEIDHGASGLSPLREGGQVTSKLSGTNVSRPGELGVPRCLVLGLVFFSLVALFLIPALSSNRMALSLARVSSAPQPTAPVSSGPTGTIPTVIPTDIPEMRGMRCLPPTSATYGFARCAFTSAQYGQMFFYLYLPPTFQAARPGTTTGQRFPLVLLLHGGGEAARPFETLDWDAHRVLIQRYAHTWSSPAVQTRFPSVILIPQMMEGSTDEPNWVGGPHTVDTYTYSPVPTPQIALVMAIMRAVQARYPQIDPHRRYITGVSVGAFGVWDIITRWPGYFAAAMPLAGAGDPSVARRLTSIPIWDFHGTDDPAVPVQASLDMLVAIRAAGGKPHFTEFRGAGHGIWNTERIYADPRVLGWLFEQRTPDR